MLCPRRPPAPNGAGLKCLPSRAVDSMAVGHEGDLESGACCKLPWRCWPSHGCHPFTEWKFLFRIRGSVIPRAMLFAVPSAALSVAFHYYFAHVGVVSENSAQANSVWASVTFVLGVLLAFRSNQALGAVGGPSLGKLHFEGRS